MAAEFERSFEHGTVDVDVTVREHNVSGEIKKPYVSIILTDVQSADDFLDIFTDDPFEINAFFKAVRSAENKYHQWIADNDT